MKILLKEINKFYGKSFSSLKEISRNQLIFNEDFSSYLSQKYKKEDISTIMLELKFSEFKTNIPKEKTFLTLDDMPDVSMIFGESDKSSLIEKKSRLLPENTKRRIINEIKTTIRRKKLSPIARHDIVREFAPILTASFAQTSSHGYRAISYHQRVKILKSTSEYKRFINTLDNTPHKKFLVKK